MSTSVKQKVEALAQPLAAEMGYEYVDTEYAKEGRDWMLTIYIDKPDGVQIDDCETFSRALEKILDEKDPVPDTYTLVVSSPGLDRPLRTLRDFERSRGMTIDVKLYKPFMGSKEFTGPLVDFTDSSVTIASGDDEITFELDETAKISLHVDI
ncbi:MAG: ribosome maturation factor RimP [Clostridia bacterium]|nr:ribosome maturation factor RimP [Clostridia bacterium]